MKKILFMMLALVGMTANAQGIKSGSKWNISNLVYEAKVNIELIKCEEAKADKDRYVTEP